MKFHGKTTCRVQALAEGRPVFTFAGATGGPELHVNVTGNVKWMCGLCCGRDLCEYGRPLPGGEVEAPCRDGGGVGAPNVQCDVQATSRHQLNHIPYRETVGDEDGHPSTEAAPWPRAGGREEDPSGRKARGPLRGGCG